MYNMFDIGQKSTFLRKGPKNLTPPPPHLFNHFSKLLQVFCIKIKL